MEQQYLFADLHPSEGTEEECNTIFTDKLLTENVLFIILTTCSPIFGWTKQVKAGVVTSAYSGYIRH